MPNRLSLWFLRQRQRIPLFVQSILSYLLVVCIMIVTLFLVVGQARQTTVSSYLNERSFALRSSVSAFERQLENFRSVACSVQSTEQYHTLRFLRP